MRVTCVVLICGLLGACASSGTVVEGAENAAAVADAVILEPDGDGDGVPDAKDKCPDSKRGETIGPNGCAVPACGLDMTGIEFKPGGLEPDAASIKRMDEAIAIGKRYPEMRIEVAGHTDHCGDEKSNLRLSQRRAQLVADYLIANGYPRGSIVGVKGYGESRPLENKPQAQPECQSRANRRVEMNVR